MSVLERFIRWRDPEKALRRERARLKLDVINSGYSRHGASHRKKSLTGWISKGASADEDIVENQETLRERSRDLYMGTPLATGALKTIRTNVVGAGLKLNANPDFEFLGITRDQAADWEKTVEREFSLWADSTDCDAGRSLTFGQMQALVQLSALASGDCFATMPIQPRKTSTYDLRVAIYEADRVCNPRNGYFDRDILGGVEVDKFGAPKRYYFASQHPGSRIRNRRPDERYLTWKPVPAFGRFTGRRNVLHIMQDVERPGQRRGAPLLAPVIESLKQLGRYTEAELMAAVVSGMFTVFVKSDTQQSPVGEMVPEDQQVDSDDPNSYEMGNGAIVGLGENESIESANPGRPNTAFSGFVEAMADQVGAALELPRELLFKHFTASYSASRAALLEAWKMFRMRRTWLIQSFCQPIYEEWLAEAVAKGRVDAPGFFEDEAIRKAWCGAHWYGPSQGQLDPQKEANGAKIRVQEEFSTRTREAAEFTGESWDAIHKLREREERLRRQDGTLAPNEAAQEPQSSGDDDEDADNPGRGDDQ